MILRKKRLVLLVCVLLIVLMLTGCMQSVIKIKLNKDGSGVMNLQIGVLDSLTSMMQGQDVFQEARSEYQSQGATVTDYKEDGYSGIRIQKSFKSLDELGGDESMGGISIKKEMVGGKVNFIVSGNPGVTKSLEESAGMTLDKMKESGKLDIRLVVEFPFATTQDNATKKSADGKTLEWDLLKVASINARAVEGTAGGGLPTWALIAIIAVVVIVIVIVLILTLGKKKKAPTPFYGQQQGYAANPSYPPAPPQAPQQPQQQYAPPVQQQPTPPQQHSFCSECGSPLNPGAQFCANCGKKV